MAISGKAAREISLVAPFIFGQGVRVPKRRSIPRQQKQTIEYAPAAPLSPAHHYPWLQRYIPAHIPHNWRQLAQGFFLGGKTAEQRFRGIRDWLFLTWPQRFLKEVKAGERGPQWVPSDNWNPWLERHLRAFTNETHAVRQGDSVFRFIGLTGSGGCGKTHASALYALGWWGCSPDDSIVVLTSTTKDMIRSRVWSVIQDYASSAVDGCTGQPVELGHLVPSQMKLYSPSKSAKHSISAYAVAHGETLKAIDNLKGLHATRMLIIIDEANGTPEAIFNVIPNYRKACLDLTVIIIGNPGSRMDPHGRALKPAEGWAIADDDKNIEWKTEGVHDWQLESGLALRFDGRDSPNMKAGRNRYPYLYTIDNWNTAQAKFKTHGGSFAYYSQDRGLWLPEGLSQVVFTEQLFVRCEALGNHFEWETTREVVAGLDPGFGSDRCVFYWGYLGEVGGRKCVQLVEHYEVAIDPTAASHDVDYQIARQVILTCKTKQIKPECFALDGTGPGRSIAAIMAAEWSDKIGIIEFGGAASDMPSAAHDGRPGNEVYANRVTQLWFSLQEGVAAGQVRGFSRDAITELCTRFYEMKGKRYCVESKVDMKVRLRYSPDVADACVVLWQAALRNGLAVSGKLIQTGQRDWANAVKQNQELYAAPDAHTEGGWADPDEDHESTTVQFKAEAWDDV